jgi:hypothetical protein
MTSATNSERNLRAFLCHSFGDKQVVRELYHHLRTDEIDPWLDEEKILPGQDWDQEIKKAVAKSDVVIVCLSERAINKRGYVQKEIKFALDVADKQPEGTIFLIPVKLEECNVPVRLQHLHWVNLFESRGYQRLLQALMESAQKLGLKDYSQWLRKHSGGNRNIIHARVSSSREIELSFSGSAGRVDNESLCIMFHLEPGLNKSVALQQIEEALRVSRIEWLALVNDLWVLRTDVLRSQIQPVRNYRWLNGHPVVYPEISHQPELLNSSYREQTVITFDTSENIIK